MEECDVSCNQYAVYNLAIHISDCGPMSIFALTYLYSSAIRTAQESVNLFSFPILLRLAPNALMAFQLARTQVKICKALSLPVVSPCSIPCCCDGRLDWQSSQKSPLNISSIRSLSNSTFGFVFSTFAAKSSYFTAGSALTKRGKITS